jgi:hypothetical protein
VARLAATGSDQECVKGLGSLQRDVGSLCTAVVALIKPPKSAPPPKPDVMVDPWKGLVSAASRWTRL